MGGMFTMVKVRDHITPGDFSDPGWYDTPDGTGRGSSDPTFGDPPRRPVESRRTERQGVLTLISVGAIAGSARR